MGRTIIAALAFVVSLFWVAACTTGDDDDDDNDNEQLINDYCYRVQECDEYQNVDICIAQMENDECNVGEAYMACLQECLDQTTLDCEAMVECEWDCSATDPC